MSELPKGLDLDQIMASEWPGDLTLGTLTEYTQSPAFMKEVRELLKGDRELRVRFLWTHTGKECSPALTLDEFREAVKANMACITIDDQGGGMRVKEDENA